MKNMKKIYFIVLLTLLILSLLSFIILLILKPDIFGQLKSVLSYISGLGFFSVISTFIFKKFKKELKVTNNLTESLNNIIFKEPVMHILLWILIIVEFGILFYFLPLYTVKVQLKSDKVIHADKVKVSLFYEETRYKLIPGNDVDNTFESTYELSWGSDGFVSLESKYFKNDTSQLSWNLLPFLDAFSGVELPYISLIPVLPDSAKIIIKEIYPPQTIIKLDYLNGQIKENYSREIVVERNKLIRFIFEFEPNYKRKDISIVAKRDTTLNINLELKNGIIVLKAKRESGSVVESMDIYIDSIKQNQKSGSLISLKPGQHDVFMEKPEGDGYWAVVDEFSIKISPGVNPEKIKIVRIERR